MFTIISDSKKAAAKQLSADLDEIKEWAVQWKVSFNPDLSKQAQGVTFTLKAKKLVHLPIFFNKKRFNKFHHKNTWVLEYVHMRGEMNSNRYETSFRLKISLRC